MGLKIILSFDLLNGEYMAELFGKEISDKGFEKSVKEVAESKDETLPASYICSSIGDYGPIDLSVPSSDEIPVIDLVELVNNLSTIEMAKFRSALISWGCFQIVNHSIDESLLHQLQHLTKQYFHLPPEEKLLNSREAEDFEGYGNDLVLFEKQPLDWMDRLYLVVEPTDQAKLKLWPKSPPSFREVVQEFTAHLRLILIQLLKSMAVSLRLPKDSFRNQFGSEPAIHARFNYYPPCSKPEAVHGQKPHADVSAITFVLLDNEVEGLQVLKDDNWFHVPVIPGALLINLGDQIEIMSNGVLKSPVHRVVTNSTSERITVAVFCYPSKGQEIGPLNELIEAQRPRLYKNVRNYEDDFFYYYHQGKRQIDSVRI